MSFFHHKSVLFSQFFLKICFYDENELHTGYRDIWNNVSIKPTLFVIHVTRIASPIEAHLERIPTGALRGVPAVGGVAYAYVCGAVHI